MRGSVRATVERIGADLYQTSGDRPRAYADATRVLLHHLVAACAAEGNSTPPLTLALSVPDRLSQASRALAAETSRDLAATDPSPTALLTRVYGDLLGLRPAPAGTFRLLSSRARKSTGSFYTPPEVAKAVVEAALDTLTVYRPDVLDPAMGTGIFLLQAARIVADRVGLAPATVAEESLHGCDIDPIAVELAVAGLALELGARPDVLRRHLFTADSLTFTFPRQFDLVVGNPPWGARDERGVRSERDSFELFLERGTVWSSESLAMVVPSACLSQPRYTPLREHLLADLDPYCVIDLGNRHFPGVAAPACGLVLGPQPGPDNVALCALSPDMTPTTVRTASRSSWHARRGWLRANERALHLLELLQDAHPLLGDLSCGYRIRDAGINYGRRDIGRRLLYCAQEPEHGDDLPRYRGRDFTRYTSIGRSGWLRRSVLTAATPGDRVSVDLDLYALPQKLVLRQTADRPICTIDRTRSALGRSVLAITAEDPATLMPLLACLNSRLMGVMYDALAGESGRILPQVKLARLRCLPIPRVCLEPEGSPGAQAWKRLGELADRLLAYEGHNPALDAEIDRLVLAAFNLDESCLPAA